MAFPGAAAGRLHLSEHLEELRAARRGHREGVDRSGERPLHATRRSERGGDSTAGGEHHRDLYMW